MKSRPRLGAAVAGAVAAVTMLSACVSLPSSGPVPVTGLNAGAGQAQQGIQFVPAPPGANWRPTEIVDGFVAASASIDDNHAAAREYLASGFRTKWKPGWAASVIDQVPDISLIPTSSHVTGGPPVATAQVDLTSQHLATLQGSGSYEAGHLLVSPGSQVYKFVLTQSGGQWRIDGIDTDGQASPTLLLLTKPDFVRDYQARNLYFFPTSSPTNILIPDPVFIPQQAGISPGAAGLVNALLVSKRAGWLNEATRTAFPVGTKISVEVSGIKAVVDLGGTASNASQEQLQRMAAQLVWTLTSRSYSASPSIRSVVLLVNHKTWSPPGGQQPLLPKDFSSWVPAGPGAPLYFQAAHSAAEPEVRVWAGATSSAPVILPKAVGHRPFTAIAVSPGSASKAYFAGCQGRNIYIAPLQRGTSVVRQTLSVNCTSLSWAGPANISAIAGPALLAPAGHEILMLLAKGPNGEGPPTVVVTPALTAGTVTSLQVAPDGVRVAMIVHTRAGSRVMVAAISQTPSNTYLGQSNHLVTVGSDIANPVALSWLDADHLVVLDHRGRAPAQLYEVPLDGGVSTQVTTPAGVTSVAASGSAVVVGTVVAGGGAGSSQDQILMSPGLIWSWGRLVALGLSPVFPG